MSDHQDLQEKIDAAVEEATKALRLNRDKILGEKKNLQSELQGLKVKYEDIDVGQAKEALQEITHLRQAKVDLEGEKSELSELLKSTLFKHELMQKAISAGIRPQALSDVQQRARHEGWEMSEAGEFKNSKKPDLEIQDWFETLRESAGHLYMPSTGGGAYGGIASRRAAREAVISSFDLEDVAQGLVKV